MFLTIEQRLVLSQLRDGCFKGARMSLTLDNLLLKLGNAPLTLRDFILNEE